MLTLEQLQTHRATANDVLKKMDEQLSTMQKEAEAEAPGKERTQKINMYRDKDEPTRRKNFLTFLYSTQTQLKDMIDLKKGMESDNKFVFGSSTLRETEGIEDFKYALKYVYKQSSKEWTTIPIDQVVWILFVMILGIFPNTQTDLVTINILTSPNRQNYNKFSIVPLLDEIIMASKGEDFGNLAIELLVKDHRPTGPISTEEEKDKQWGHRRFNRKLFDVNSLESHHSSLSTLSETHPYPFNSGEWNSFLEKFKNAIPRIVQTSKKDVTKAEKVLGI